MRAVEFISENLAEATHQLRWEVEQHTAGHHNAFYLVKGYDRPRAVWKDARGMSDFRSRAAAEAKAAELNQTGVAGEFKGELDSKDRFTKDTVQKMFGKLSPDAKGVAEDLDAQFDSIEEMVESLAREHGVDADVIWEDFESVDDNELLETAAWRRKEGKSKKGGLNAKGVASYRRENPGSKLQTAVTTKPSKLKPGSKAAKRRKSFCARMSGVKGPMKKPNGKPTRKALALRKWNC